MKINNIHATNQHLDQKIKTNVTICALLKDCYQFYNNVYCSFFFSTTPFAQPRNILFILIVTYPKLTQLNRSTHINLTSIWNTSYLSCTKIKSNYPYLCTPYILNVPIYVLCQKLRLHNKLLN